LLGPANDAVFSGSSFRVPTFYEQLYQDCPELSMQLENPDPLLLIHDQVAMDSTNRFVGKTEDAIVMSFIKSIKDINYYDYIKFSTDEWLAHSSEYYMLKRIMNEVYYYSPTFRRLFNYAYDFELQFPGNRWLIAPREAFSTTITQNEFSAAGGVRTIGLNVEFIDSRYYEAENGPVPYTAEHAYLNELIKALTGFQVQPSEFYLRGPIVEYTNIVLMEVGRELSFYRVPIRTSSVTRLSNEQLGAISHYKTLSNTYPELRMQTENPDPFLLDHDRIAVDSSDQLSHRKLRVIDLMFKKYKISMPTKLYGKTPNFKYLESLLEKHIQEVPLFRRLFNFALLKYNWDNAINRVKPF
jgi:hypothetical protein